MSNKSVSIFIPVKNGEKYIRHCLDAVFEQSYQQTEVVVFDNGSTDKTLDIVEKEYPRAKIYKNDKNLFVGPAFNKGFEMGLCQGEYILLLCVDVLLDKDFILKAVERMESDQKIGALQAKILKFDFAGKEINKTDIIDTTGFEIFRSRRAVNRGHGEKDDNQYESGEIISYEGAAGFFRKKALEEAKINNEIFDEDFGWMVDDLDLGWRLTVLSWKNFYDKSVICWHDRKTTKRLSAGKFDFINQRKEIPALKRKLDYRNKVLTIFKNDIAIYFLKDLWYILKREMQLFLYILFFEWSTLPAVWETLFLLPKMAGKRAEIMKKRKISDREIREFFK